MDATAERGTLVVVVESISAAAMAVLLGVCMGTIRPDEGDVAGLGRVEVLAVVVVVVVVDATVADTLFSSGPTPLTPTHPTVVLVPSLLLPGC